MDKRTQWVNVPCVLSDADAWIRALAQANNGDEAMDPESTFGGLEAAGEIQLTGAWQADTFGIFDDPRREVTICPEAVTLFGVSWWAMRYKFMAHVEWNEAAMSAQIQPTQPLIIERSEWWRWLGFHVLKYPARIWRRLTSPTGRTEQA
jgi:hypothetical protein